MENTMIEQFKEAMMFHQVRQRKFSQHEMDYYGIRAIYNLVGIVEKMDYDTIRGYASRCTRPGSDEIAISERLMDTEVHGNPVTVCSIIVFKDRFRFGFFALKDGLRARYYHDGEFDEPVLSLLN